MSLDKAIAHGKEKRKPYRGSKAIDCTCRNHGSCQWCVENRTHKFRDKESDRMIINIDETMREAVVKEMMGIPWDKGIHEAIEDENDFEIVDDFGLFYDDDMELIAADDYYDDTFVERVVDDAKYVVVFSPWRAEDFCNLFSRWVGDIEPLNEDNLKVGDVLELILTGSTGAYVWKLIPWSDGELPEKIKTAVAYAKECETGE